MMLSVRETAARTRRLPRLVICLAFLGDFLYGPAHLAEEAHLESRAHRDRPASASLFASSHESTPSHDPHSSDDHILKAAPPRTAASSPPSVFWSGTDAVCHGFTALETCEPTARGPPPDPPRPFLVDAKRAPGAPRAPPAV